MPNLNRLSNEDFMAITRAMDSNRNNRIDRTEATISWRAQSEIGNSNGVAGTRETANALASGDVFITRFQPEAADKIADYFSKHNENFNRPVAEWISDGFISKEDLDLDADTRRALDTNNDNRVSSREFAAALVSGALTVGQTQQVSQNPFSQPAAHSQNPFDSKPDTKPATNYNSNPFGGGKPDMKPDTKPTNNYNTNPFGGKPDIKPEVRDSGAYLQIEMTRTMRSDFEKSQVLNSLATKTDLSPREQVMLAEAAVGLSSDFSRGQVLQAMAANRSLSEAGQVAVAANTRSVSSEFTRGQILTGLMQNQRLGYDATAAVVKVIEGLNGDFSKTQQYISLNQNQKLSPDAKALVLRSAQEHISSDFSKRQVMQALF